MAQLPIALQGVGFGASFFSLLSALPQTTKRVLACETTPAYRAAAINNAFAGDVVLEIGCHEGGWWKHDGRRCFEGGSKSCWYEMCT